MLGCLFNVVDDTIDIIWAFCQVVALMIREDVNKIIQKIRGADDGGE